MAAQVGALFVRDGRVLLCLRSATRRYYPGVWDVPGGHVEAGETPVAALRRELMEELGVAVELAGAGDTIVVDEELGIHLSLWTVSAWTGTLSNRCPQEHERIEWFTSDQADALDLADDRYRPLIRKALAAAAT